MNLIWLLAVIPVIGVLWFSRKKQTKSRSDIRKTKVIKSEMDASNPITKWVRNISGDTADVANNTRLVRELTQIVNPIDATAADVFYLHRCIAAYDEFDLIIKVSIHYNLFCRAIKAMGTDKHLSTLQLITQSKQLGAFALTETGAGVLSGMVVETIAVCTKDGFVIRTPHKRSRKYWISGGRSCDYMVVYASVVMESSGDKRGIHAFLIKMADHSVKYGEFGYIDECYKSEVAPNTIIIEDVIAEKNCITGTDNVSISFNDINVSSDALLDKNYSVAAMLKGEKYPSFIRQMNSLISGRICIADGSLELLKNCFLFTHNYVYNQRQIYINDKLKQCALGELEHIKSLMSEVETGILQMEKYLRSVQSEFGKLETMGVSFAFLKKVNICKAYIPVMTLKYMRDLANIIGSKVYDKKAPTFMAEKVYVATIAEGDSTVLTIKLAMDQLKYGDYFSFQFWNEISLKAQLVWQLVIKKTNRFDWYIANTKKLYELGFQIAEKEILEF